MYVKSGNIKSNTWKSKDGKENSQLEVTIFELDKIQEQVKEDTKENRFKRWDTPPLGEPIFFEDTPFE